jgi:hypothetical protein
LSTTHSIAGSHGSCTPSELISYHTLSQIEPATTAIQTSFEIISRVIPLEFDPKLLQKRSSSRESFVFIVSVSSLAADPAGKAWVVALKAVTVLRSAGSAHQVVGLAPAWVIVGTSVVGSISPSLHISLRKVLVPHTISPVGQLLG